MGKTTVRISLLLIVASLLTLAVLNVLTTNRNGQSTSAIPSSSTSTSANVPDVPGVPVVPVEAIPTSGGHPWRIASDSNTQLAQCLTKERINFAQLHTLNYSNDMPEAQANVSWITGVIAPPDYFTSAVQLCVNGTAHPSDLTELSPGDSGASETTATNGPIRSYASATSVNGMMLLTFWTQPGAPAITPSPANAMAFRAVALYKLAEMGVANPKVVACQMVAERPIAKVPPEVVTLINAQYAKLAPVKILSQYTGVVDVRAESVTPHICLYSDGRQVAYAGKVPTSATQALEVDVQHAPSPPTESVENFVMLAKIPTKGWIVVSEGTSP